MKADIEAQLSNKLRKRLMRLPDFIADYILHLEFQKKEIRTRIEYAKDIELFLEFLMKAGLTDAKEIKDIESHELQNLKPKDIMDFLSYLTLYEKKYTTPTGKEKVREYTNSNSGKSRKMASLHEFFAYLLEEEIISKDITKKIDVKVDSNATIKNRLTPEDMDKFYSTILEDWNITNNREMIYAQKLKFRDYIIVLLLSYTGIRISELVQLDLGDIGIEEQAMVVLRKGGNKEKIDLPSIIVEDLTEFLTQREQQKLPIKAIFVSMHKKRINTNTIRAMLDKYRIRAGIKIKITPHVFRRTFGTEHYNRYRDMYLTAQIMGHSSAETTRKFYADPAEERKRKSMKEFGYHDEQKDDTPSSPISISPEKLKELEQLTGMKLAQHL